MEFQLGSRVPIFYEKLDSEPCHAAGGTDQKHWLPCPDGLQDFLKDAGHSARIPLLPRRLTFLNLHCWTKPAAKHDSPSFADCTISNYDPFTVGIRPFRPL
jgi:hypothetical protein